MKPTAKYIEQCLSSEKTCNLTIRKISEDLKNWLRRTAAKEGVKVEGLVTAALVEYIDTVYPLEKWKVMRNHVKRLGLDKRIRSVRTSG